MSEDGITVVGDAEIDFKDTVTELVVKQESFVRVGVIIPVDGAESVSDVRRCGGPLIIKFVRRAGWLRSRLRDLGGWRGRGPFEDEKTADGKAGGCD